MLPTSKSVSALLLLLSCVACSRQSEPTDAQESAAAPVAAAGTAATTGSSSAADQTKYLCSSNLVIPATYTEGSVTLKVKDETLELSADPENASRYTGQGVEWWVNGRGQGGNGNLYSQGPDGTAGDLVQGCVENPES